MEQNATKALLMAAGVLIGIIMLSLGVYLVTSMRNFSKNYNDSLEAQQLEQFNSKFTVFQNRENISIHEIISLVNIAEEFNKTNNIEANNRQHINIYVDFGKGRPREINLTNISKDLKTTKYRDNPNQFINDLLDGIYIYSIYGDSVEKEGQFQYEYIEDSINEKKYKKYYNCFQYVNDYINPETGRIEYISFKFLPDYQEEINKKANKN